MSQLDIWTQTETNAIFIFIIQYFLRTMRGSWIIFIIALCNLKHKRYNFEPKFCKWQLCIFNSMQFSWVENEDQTKDQSGNHVSNKGKMAGGAKLAPTRAEQG